MRPARRNHTNFYNKVNAGFDSHTLANALIKILPNYIKLQRRINETLHSQLPKKL